MRRFYISLLTLVFAAIQVFAAPIDPVKALDIANRFWESNVSLKKDKQFKLVPVRDAQKAPSHLGSSTEDAEYYLFTETNNNGFVIVSGDDRLNPIVGYSTNAASSEMPSALAAWLDEYSDYVNDVREGRAVPSQHNTTATYTKIEPMLVTAWDQDAPYNNLCPLLNGKRTFTGCGNTATAQVMRFHKWPASPIADVEWDNNITGETEFCELKSHVYDWDNMLHDYKSDYSTAEAEAVALLMADLGKATNSTYEAEGTGNTDMSIVKALVNVFNYSPEVFIAKRTDYTFDEYIALIRDNLDKRQPIIYAGFGQDYEGGHGFVCDGIDENNLLHIDWGWNGAYNGYFDMASMQPEGTGIGGFSSRFNVGQNAILNIKPRTEGEENKNVIPTVAFMEVCDNETDEIYNEYSSTFEDGIASVSFTFGVINKSYSDTKGSVGIGILDMNGELAKELEFGDPEVYVAGEGNMYFDGYTLDVSNVKKEEEYLPVGTYLIGLFYMNDEEEVEYLLGANNKLLLEVTNDGVKLSSFAPRIELSSFSIIKMPEHSNEKFVFDATFVNKNNINSLVMLVPVINHYEDGIKVKSERLIKSAIAMEVVDVNNCIVTFTIPNAFAQSGTYTISFEYVKINEAMELDLEANQNRLKSIEGECDPFDVEIIPEETEEPDYNFEVEFIGQETDGTQEIAVLRTTVGKDISEYKFAITGDTDEENLEAIVEGIASGELEDCYTANQSADLRIPLEAGEYAIVVVLYDVNGEPLDEYYSYIFNLTTGIENIEDGQSVISIDWNNNVVSVAEEGVIELLDASGIVVKRVNGCNLSIANLEKGIYIVKNNKNVVKVVKR